MSKKLPHEFVKKAYLDGGIKLLSEYVNYSVKNKLECITCGYEWYSMFHNFKGGCRCPKCGIKKNGNRNRFRQKFVEKEYLKANIKLLSQYKNSQTKNKLTCLICDHIWKARYSGLWDGDRCPKCGLKKRSDSRRHSHDFIEKEYLKANIKLLSQYTGANNKNKLECIKCNQIWNAKYNTFQSGHGCPSCAKTGFDPSKPAYQYIFKLDIHEGIFYKIGVCNTENIEKRLKTVHEQCRLVSKTYFEIGKDAQIEESRLHKLNSKHRVNLKGIVASGYTEFFDIPPLI